MWVVFVVRQSQERDMMVDVMDGGLLSSCNHLVAQVVSERWSSRPRLAIVISAVAEQTTKQEGRLAFFP